MIMIERLIGETCKYPPGIIAPNLAHIVGEEMSGEISATKMQMEFHHREWEVQTAFDEFIEPRPVVAARNLMAPCEENAVSHGSITLLAPVKLTPGRLQIYPFVASQPIEPVTSPYTRRAGRFIAATDGSVIRCKSMETDPLKPWSKGFYITRLGRAAIMTSPVIPWEPVHDTHTAITQRFISDLRFGGMHTDIALERRAQEKFGAFTAELAEYEGNVLPFTHVRRTGL
jgi:hypothetical protein